MYLTLELTDLLTQLLRPSVSFLFGELHLAELRIYSWFFAQDSLLVGFREPYVVLVIEPGLIVCKASILPATLFYLLSVFLLDHPGKFWDHGSMIRGSYLMPRIESGSAYARQMSYLVYCAPHLSLKFLISPTTLLISITSDCSFLICALILYYALLTIMSLFL